MKSKPPFFAQERDNSCTLACLRMVLASFGLPVPAEEDMIDPSVLDTTGIWMHHLEAIAKKAGLEVSVEDPNDIDLYQFISSGAQIIVFLERLKLDGEDSQHAIVPFDVSDADITCLDPLWSSAIPPGERRIPKSNFQEARRRLRFCLVCTKSVEVPEMRVAEEEPSVQSC